MTTRQGNLAALIAGLLRIRVALPVLLLVAYSILALIARNNAKLATRLTNALHNYPVIGTHLSGTGSQGLGKTGLRLC